MTRLGEQGSGRSRPRVDSATLPVWRRLIYASLPLVVLLVCAALALEVGLRLRFDSTDQITGAGEWQPAGFGGFVYRWDVYHPILGWTNLPGYRSDASIPFRVTINAKGLRATREYGPEADPGVERIALFGDSLAFGEEVDDGETIAAHLERARAATEVLNFGVHGYSFGQSVLRLEHEGAAFNPDHSVITVLFPEDLFRDRVSHFLHAKPVFVVEDGALKVENIPVPEASRTPLIIRESYATAWLFGRRGAWHRRAVEPDIDHELARAVAEHAAAVCRDRSTSLTLVAMLAPAGVQRYVSDPVWRRRFDADRARFLNLEVRTLDLVPTQVDAYLVRGESLFAPLAHWSSEGNRVWAEWLAARLD